MQPRIQHLALNVNDPFKTAEYYKRVFGLKEMNRNSHGVWMTDGYIYFAVLMANSGDRTPLAGGVGFQHCGFAVEDLDGTCDAIERAGAKPTPDSTSQNRKYQDPDGICVDIRAADDGFWDRRNGTATQVLKLVPAN